MPRRHAEHRGPLKRKNLTKRQLAGPRHPLRAAGHARASPRPTPVVAQEEGSSYTQTASDPILRVPGRFCILMLLLVFTEVTMWRSGSQLAREIESERLTDMDAAWQRYETSPEDELRSAVALRAEERDSVPADLHRRHCHQRVPPLGCADRHGKGMDPGP